MARSLVHVPAGMQQTQHGGGPTYHPCEIVCEVYRLEVKEGGWKADEADGGRLRFTKEGWSGETYLGVPREVAAWFGMAMGAEVGYTTTVASVFGLHASWDGAGGDLVKVAALVRAWAGEE